MPYTGSLHVTLAKYFASTLTNKSDQRFCGPRSVLS